MSGIEIIGVVLGAFPIAVMALEKYSKLATSVNLFYSIRSEHKRCLDDLTYHQILFKIHLRRLLLPLAVDDDKIDELLDNPGGTSWKEKSIDDVLKRRMKDAYLPYFGYVKEMARVMNDLNQRLALDSEAVQNNLSNQKALKGIERLRFEASPERIAFQRFRIKFSNGESDRKRLLSEFENYNGKLKALLDFSDEDARLTQQRKLMFHNSATDLAVCNVWKQAAKLFRALTSACYFIASSFLQLLESQWLPATLKKTEIFFRSDPSNSTRFRLDQPYIRRQFNNSNEKTVPYLDPGATELADSLDQLGIILLELCFGKVLEQQPCRKKWPDGRDAREVAGFNLLAARDWQCQVPEEAGPDYAEAVGWCLDKGKSRPPERWRKDMLQSVIHPLQRCREYLAGS
ncbi:hypothetical protein Forpi1262_v001948 [Fusarium oxysporum f. sp. raphani]|uniref:DUF7580 domain-containing protein n=1 Tax=Fusarium oxysporum f. sp. raphani TaxID=96318 RepID=A0A8J5QB29_FUSOX|nr:hypothetical protein Forpi1262_v001948 [Fusarium oxysporum f. sp. raphani]